jgi:hypothetical protein
MDNYWQEVDDAVFQQSKKNRAWPNDQEVVQLWDILENVEIDEWYLRYDALDENHWIAGLPWVPGVGSLWNFAQKVDEKVVQLRVRDKVFRLSPSFVEGDEVWTFARWPNGLWTREKGKDIGEAANESDILPHLHNILLETKDKPRFVPCEKDSDFYKGCLRGNFNVRDVINPSRASSIFKSMDSERWLEFVWPAPQDADDLIVFRNCARFMLRKFFGIHYAWENSEVVYENDELIKPGGPPPRIVLAIRSFLGKMYPNFVRKIDALFGVMLPVPKADTNDLQRICPELRVYALGNMQTNEDLVLKLMMYIIAMRPSWQVPFFYAADLNLEAQTQQPQTLSSEITAVLAIPELPNVIIFTVHVLSLQRPKQTHHALLVVHRKEKQCTFYQPTHNAQTNETLRRELDFAHIDTITNVTPQGQLPQNITGLPACLFLALREPDFDPDLSFDREQVAKMELELRRLALQWIRLYQQRVERQLKNFANSIAFEARRTPELAQLFDR